MSIQQKKSRRADFSAAYSDRKCVVLQLTTAQQTAAFLWAFIPGALLGLLYVIIRSFRIISPPGALQLFLGDVLFMLTAGIVNSLYAVSQTEGKVRLYVLAAQGISFFVVYFFVGRPLFSFIRFIHVRVSSHKQRIMLFLNKKIVFIGSSASGFIKKFRIKQKK